MLSLYNKEHKSFSFSRCKNAFSAHLRFQTRHDQSWTGRIQKKNKKQPHRIYFKQFIYQKRQNRSHYMRQMNKKNSFFLFFKRSQEK